MVDENHTVRELERLMAKGHTLMSAVAKICHDGHYTYASDVAKIHRLCANYIRVERHKVHHEAHSN